MKRQKKIIFKHQTEATNLKDIATGLKNQPRDSTMDQWKGESENLRTKLWNSPPQRERRKIKSEVKHTKLRDTIKWTYDMNYKGERTTMLCVRSALLRLDWQGLW